MKSARTIFAKMVSSAAVLLFATFAHSQTLYPPTIIVPVTFYDFHSDRSNPEFEQPCMAGIHAGMVADTLDANRNPFLGPSPYLDYGIAKWFRLWAPGDFTAPSYQKVSGGEFDAVIAYAGMKTATFDTSCKNMMFQDSLTFTYVAGSTGIFKYSDSVFFPLDGRGFGNEGLGHNYSFTMHLGYSSLALGRNQTLKFETGDDMWVFVDGKLVKDLGGINSPKNGLLNLDSVPGDKTAYHNLDVFYTQRHSPSSTITMQLCLIADLIGPTWLSMNLVPRSDTITAGDSVVFVAAIIDNLAKVHPEFDTCIHWSIVPANSGNWLSPAVGSRVTYHAVEAYRNSFVNARFADPAFPGIEIVQTDTLYVKPGMALQWSVEPYPPSLFAVLGGHASLDSLLFSANDSQKIITALFRDRYGNFAWFDTNATWQVQENPGVIRVSAPDEPYRAVIDRLAAGTASVKVVSGFLTKTIAVVVSGGTQAKSLEALSALQKPRMTKEYFNLRGQKLLLYGIRRTDGIVLERTFEPGGMITVRRKSMSERMFP
jgi:fibro-slime domain-containing protein